MFSTSRMAQRGVRMVGGMLVPRGGVRQTCRLVSVSVLCGLLVLVMGPISSRPAYAASIVVNSTWDDPDTNVADGICRTAMGTCTLRAAIQQANAMAGRDAITFNLPGGGPFTIRPRSPLPDIVDPVVIDGMSQPGYAGSPLIQLYGVVAGAGGNIQQLYRLVSSSGSDIHGLWIAAGSSTVKGLAIHSFSGAGIVLYGKGNNLIQGNYVGTDLGGRSAMGNGDGVVVLSSNNVIGVNVVYTQLPKIEMIEAVAKGRGNLISGNRGYGVILSDVTATGNYVSGNYIGTDATGMMALGNGQHGVMIGNARRNTIGGVIAAAGNIISGNQQSGIAIGASGFPSFWGNENLIQNNRIGTDATGSGRVPNGAYGLWIDAGSGNTIRDNMIAHNGYSGVSIWSGTRNVVRNNSIHDNGRIGIDLGTDGATANDQQDLDRGANNLQNYPVLSWVNEGSMRGSLTSTPNTTFIVDLYENDRRDQWGYRYEGQRLLRSLTVTTNTSGFVEFQAVQLLSVGCILNTCYPQPPNVTATATDALGNTSEFSPAVNYP